MARAILIVLDSVGIGGARDAAAYGDAGADTVGHIAEACAQGAVEGRAGPLALPNLVRLGLGQACRMSSGGTPPGLQGDRTPDGAYGFASETSEGKDTQTGHWEIAGCPVPFAWGYFPDTVPAIPAEITEALVRRCNLRGLLGNRHASGTQIIAELGEEHLRTGKPIIYTSADSVLQIAAHEDAFGLERLYNVCETTRVLVDPLNIGRVIARPFVGRGAEDFTRTGNRRDYAVPPPEPTLLDHVGAAGGRVFAIGKVADIFAQRGVSRALKASGNDALFDATLAAMSDAGEGDLVFANLIDFDQLYGHTRDVAGYAAALEAFDARLPELEAQLGAGDLVVLTADHGCDPTWRGSDHTRENVPVLAFGPQIAAGSIGRRATFADIGQTIAAHLGIAPLRHGVGFR